MHELAILLSGCIVGLGIGVSLRSLVDHAVRVQRERRDVDVRPRPWP